MPDVEIKPQRYKDERPKEYFDQYHARVRDGEPEAKVYELVRITTVLTALTISEPVGSTASECRAAR